MSLSRGFIKNKMPIMNKNIKTVKRIHELSQLVSWKRIEAIRELPLLIIPIILLLLTCSTPEDKNTKPAVESVKIKGRIQIIRKSMESLMRRNLDFGERSFGMKVKIIKEMKNENF